MQIVMGWPEWIFASIMAIQMWVNLYRGFGKSDPASVLTAFVVPAIWTPLLYWGGFFS